MSGHSKWATIRRKKEKIDSARGKTFSKLIKEITIAARIGGGDANGNPRLRTAVDAAKNSNMPASNIDRAIQKGTGDLEGVNYEEITYEAYGPGGTAMLIEVMTDNRNRTIGEIRNMISKAGGNMGESGSVGWMFARKGSIALPANGLDEDSVMLAALDAGAEDVRNEDGYYQIATPPDQLYKVKDALEKAGFKVESANLEMIAANYVPVEGKQAAQLTRLLELLDEHDDVQNVWSNSDMPEEEEAEA